MCSGGVNAKCNCDLEDGTEQVDGGVMVDNERLPVCRICVTLDGNNPGGGRPSVPTRSVTFKVSDLVCSNHKLGKQIMSILCETL